MVRGPGRVRRRFWLPGSVPGRRKRDKNHSSYLFYYLEGRNGCWFYKEKFRACAGYRFRWLLRFSLRSPCVLRVFASPSFMKQQKRTLERALSPIGFSSSEHPPPLAPPRELPVHIRFLCVSELLVHTRFVREERPARPPCFPHTRDAPRSQPNSLSRLLNSFTFFSVCGLALLNSFSLAYFV